MALVSPDPRDLTTWQSAWNWMNSNASPPKQEEQNIVQQCITGASLQWLHWTGRKTLNNIFPFNEAYDGAGRDRQFLRNTPILKVFSLNVAGIAIPQSTDGLTVPGWIIDDDRESLSLIGSNFNPAIRPSGSYGVTGTNYRVWGGWNFTQGRQTVKVSYLAGYNYQSNEPWAIASPITVKNAGSFVIDMGVTMTNTGMVMTPVPSAPASGQYVVTSSGVYTFNAADVSAGGNISIAYGYNGVPADIQEAMNKFVWQNYKRRQTTDEKSRIVPGTGTVTYRDWVMAPEVDRVIQSYKRQALLVS